MDNSQLRDLFNSAQQGNEAAQEQIAAYFFPQAVSMARRKLPVAPSPMADHEDLANSAMRSLCMAIRHGRVEYQGDRQLGAALKKIIYRKASKYWRGENSQKRNRNLVIDENGLGHGSDKAVDLAQLAVYDPGSMILNDDSIALTQHDQGPVDAVLADMESELHGLFKKLMANLDEKPRKVLLKLIEGDYSNKQLSREIGCAVASIERYRAAIRRQLERLDDEEIEHVD
jgi:RNA polymerase sigma factor (sigma-70 family)